MIKLENVDKYYNYHMDTEVHALKNVNLTINDGEMVAIMGVSGSGKSTMLHILGCLDSQTKGKYFLGEYEVCKYSSNTIAEIRNEEIGFVLQNFGLLSDKSVYENISYPLIFNPAVKYKMMKRLITKAAEDMLVSDLLKKPVKELSGGQKQRVAIARALANTPKILLCDEATSALDPTTTKEILKLLQDINKQYGITIVIITHEMAVVQEICSHVAIIDAGELAEHGTVEEVFSRPQSQAARKLVFMVDPKAKEMSGKRCIRIVFTENSSFEPVIANMVLECKAPVNILLADTKDIGGIAHGQMILQLPEDEMAANKMIHYLQERKLEVEELKDYVG